MRAFTGATAAVRCPWTAAAAHHTSLLGEDAIDLNRYEFSAIE
jgi:hypothetical protein